ncbi:MAG: tRNA glutamyl-Q(34) synthetase GluQRS [Pseudomonadota bacterium]
MAPPKFRTRFAPSPTGRLHLGHAFAALTAFEAARAASGVCLLRMEDIDRTRCKPEFEAAIYDDLAWLGLDWPTPVRRQSDHFSAYRDALSILIDRRLVYRCFKTRKEILAEIARAPHAPPDGPEGPAYVGAPLPDEEERSLLEAGAPYAWRLSMARARDALGGAFQQLAFHELINGERRRVVAQPDKFGDIVIARKDAGTSYHLASVFDDALQEVTHVIRGVDLRPSAHLHRLLQALLGAPAPVYQHHRLILNADGKRLAKRDQAQTLSALRQDGATPSDIRRQLGFRI